MQEADSFFRSRDHPGRQVTVPFNTAIHIGWLQTNKESHGSLWLRTLPGPHLSQSQSIPYAVVIVVPTRHFVAAAIASAGDSSCACMPGHGNGMLGVGDDPGL